MDNKKQAQRMRRIRNWMQKGIYDAFMLAGIREEQVLKYLNPKNIDEFTVDVVCNYLKDLVEPCNELLRHKELHDDGMWTSLELRHSTTPFPEVTKFRRLKKKVRGLWNVRPKF